MYYRFGGGEGRLTFLYMGHSEIRNRTCFVFKKNQILHLPIWRWFSAGIVLDCTKSLVHVPKLPGKVPKSPQKFPKSSLRCFETGEIGIAMVTNNKITWFKLLKHWFWMMNEILTWNIKYFRLYLFALYPIALKMEHTLTDISGETTQNVMKT